MDKRSSVGWLRDRQTWLVAMLSVLSILCFGYVGQQAERHILMHELQTGTNSWSDFLAKRLEPNAWLRELIEDDAGEDSEAALIEARGSIVEALDAVLHSGSIYQVDLISEDCYCAISVGSYANFVNGLELPDLGWKQRHAAAAQHIIGGDNDHAAVPGLGSQLGVDRRLAAQALEINQPVWSVVRTPEPGQPAVFGQAYYPLQTAAGERYVLRLLLDLSGKAAFYGTLVWVAVGLTAVVFWGLTWLAARRARRDMDARVLSDARAHYLAEHDPLTGLLNRNGFELKVGAMLDRAAGSGDRVRIILVDIDTFKDINGYYGLSTGDDVLRGLAELLQGHFSAQTVIARLGADDFAAAVTVDGAAGEEDGQLLPSGFDVLVDDGNRLLDVRVSGGTAQFPADGDSLQALFQAADLALQSAKEHPDGAVVGYDETMSTLLQRRIWQANGVRGALDRDELVPYYQPLVDAATGRVEGFEALVRWNHPDHGILTPINIRAGLEDPHLLPRISDRMVDLILGDLCAWRDAGLPYFSVGLNVTEADLRRPDFVETLTKKIAAAGLRNAQLAIEVTETTVSQENKAELLPKLGQLREAGFFIGLDDFGTGHSSVTLLKDVPATAVKIDKSFVSGICESAADQTIVRHLVPLAHDMGYRVVAEGVEDRAQFDFVRDAGVDLVQGWLFAPAVPTNEVPALIRRLNAGLPWAAEERSEAG